MKTSYCAGMALLSLLLSACGGGGGDSGGGGTTTVPSEFLLSTTVTAGNGSFSPVSANVSAGQSRSFVVTPATGFSIGTVSGCGGTLTGQNYQTAAVTAACTISATFTPMQYNLTATAGSGGSISPASVQVAHGQSVSFSLVPAADYVVDKVTGCDGTLSGNSYQINAVTSACNLTATFSKSAVNLTVTAGAGGRISPGSSKVAAGTVQSFTLTPDAGFEITSVSGCGGVLTGSTFTTAALTTDCAITASFNKDSEVVFPDAALNTAVRQALGLNSSEPVLKSRLAGLSTLQLNGAGVSQLRGLRFASGLLSLSANNNKISDLTELSGLSRLTQLQLNSNPVTDLTPLSALPLKALYLYNTDIGELNALATMTLTHLDVSNTAVSSLAGLQNVSQLRYLSASYSGVADISTLQNATQLKVLYLFDTLVSRLEPLLTSGLASQGADVGVTGCLDLKGFSRATLVLDQLKKAGATVQANNIPRTDCPDTLGNIAITASSYQENEKIGVRWQLSNTQDNGEWACEVHLDLQTDIARLPQQKISNCSLSGQQLLDLSTRQNSYQLSLLFDNGLGGEKLVRLPLSSPTGAAPVLAGVDFGQVVMKSNPLLVPGREALLRLHLIAATAPAQLPVVTVEASGVGALQTLTATAPAQVPVAVNYQSLSNSYQLKLPASLLQPGLQLAVRVNGENLRTLTPSFASQNKLAVLLVPFSQVKDSTTTTAELPEPASLAAQIKSFWPLAEVDVRTRAPYVLKSAAGATTAYTMLDELSDLRAAENGKVYYYGYFKSAMGDGCCGGLGFRPGYEAVGMDSDLNGNTMAHELGHNLNLQHIDCGAPPNADLRYPYNGNSIGSVGINSALTELRQPNSYRDVMSYCSPKHVSDYHFEKAQDFLLTRPEAAFASPAADHPVSAAAMAERALYISGSIGVDGQLSIRTVLPVNRAAVQYPASVWQFRLFNSAGQQLQVNPLLPEYGHPAAVPGTAARAQPFRFEIPLQDISRIEVWRAEQLVSQLDVSAQAQSLAGTAPVADVQERSNEVCVSWPARQGLSLSLIHHQSDQITALALNETSGQLCRESQALPAGGQWQLVWRRGLNVQEQWLPR